MIVVSDTSPLNYLVLVGQEHVLPVLFARVVCPPAVISEMLHTRAPEMVKGWASSPPSWLEVIAPFDIDRTLPLGLGELEAISLAQEIRADALLLDERKAFAIARQLGLSVTGTIGVLELAAKRHLIDLPPVVAELRRTNFRCSDAVFDELLRRDEIRRSKHQGKKHRPKDK